MYGRNYYRPDQYVSKRVMEKRALPYIQGELLRLHSNNAQMLSEESELEFLKVANVINKMNIMSCAFGFYLKIQVNMSQLPVSYSII